MPRSVAFPWPTAVKAPHARLSTPPADRCDAVPASRTRSAGLVEGHFGLLADGTTAVVETAEASGLALLEAKERNPLIASSYGTGELMLAAVRSGAKRIIVGLGGSATNDAGAGLLQALGVRLLGRVTATTLSTRG